MSENDLFNIIDDIESLGDDISILIPDFKEAIRNPDVETFLRHQIATFIGAIGEIAYLEELLSDKNSDIRMLAYTGISEYGESHNKTKAVNLLKKGLKKEKDFVMVLSLAMSLSHFDIGKELGVKYLKELEQSPNTEEFYLSFIKNRLNAISVEDNVKDLQEAIEKLPESKEKEKVREEVISLDEKVSMMQHKVADRMLSGDEKIDFSKLLTSYEIKKKKAETYSIHEDIKLNQAEQELRKAKAVAAREEIALEKDRLELEKLKERNLSKRWRWEQIVAIINLVITTVLAIVLPIFINKG